MAAPKAKLKDDTRHWQSELASYCRTGEDRELSGVSADRLKHYRRLVFNIAYDTLQTAYPITHRILSKEEWRGLVTRFFANHPCQNYRVWKMPYELNVYLENHEEELKNKYPFLQELVYFEWIEIEVYCEEDQTVASFQDQGDWKQNTLVVNPHHRLLGITYPFHQVKAEEVEAHKGAYYILVLRDPEQGRVQFLQLSPLFFLALQQLEACNYRLDQALMQAGQHFGIEDPGYLLDQSQTLVDLLFKRQFILGYSA